MGASSNDPREYLGQLLLNFGHIDEEQLQKAFQTQEETKIRLGRVLTMVGLISRETVTEVLAIKIRETALDAFRWDSGLFSFDDEPPAANDELDAEVPLADIVKEAEFRATAWNAFRGEFPSGTSSLEVEEGRVTGRPRRRPRWTGGCSRWRARGLTIDEIGLALHATDFHLYQRLYALARRGVLRAAPERDRGGGGHRGGGGDGGAPRPGQGPARRRGGSSRPSWPPPGRSPRRPAPSRRGRSWRGPRPSCAGSSSAELTDPPRVPALRLRPDQLGALTLSSADRYLLSRCDGRRTVRQIVQVAPLQELEVLKALRRFADAGVIRLGTPTWEGASRGGAPRRPTVGHGPGAARPRSGFFLGGGAPPSFARRGGGGAPRRPTAGHGPGAARPRSGFFLGGGALPSFARRGGGGAPPATQRRASRRARAGRRRGDAIGEVGRQRLARHLGGPHPPERAVDHHRGHHHLRVLRRRVADEPGVVAEGGLLVERAGLAGHRHALELARRPGEGAGGGAVAHRLAHHGAELLGHPLVDDPHRLLDGGHLAALHEVHRPGRHQHALVGHHRADAGRRGAARGARRRSRRRCWRGRSGRRG